MTPQQRLQEAKDQAARDLGYENWFYADLSKHNEEALRDKGYYHVRGRQEMSYEDYLDKVADHAAKTGNV